MHGNLILNWPCSAFLAQGQMGKICIKWHFETWVYFLWAINWNHMSLLFTSQLTRTSPLPLLALYPPSNHQVWFHLLLDTVPKALQCPKTPHLQGDVPVSQSPSVEVVQGRCANMPSPQKTGRWIRQGCSESLIVTHVNQWKQKCVD